jgi:enoyl-CoA hydratase/carnithine racemase
MSEPNAMSEVRVEVSNQVMTISLDRARKKNAVTDAMYNAITVSLHRAQHDADIHVVLLTGEGADFCAGNDINVLMGMHDSGDTPVSYAEAFLTALSTFPKPMIAAVQGMAIGIGATLLLHCDLIFAAPDTQLKMPFVDLGLVPEAGSARLLPAIVGHPKAFSIFAFGQPLSGSAAADLGLVSHVVPREELQLAALDAARALARKPPAALAATKALMRDSTAIRAALAADRAALLERLSSPEAAVALAQILSRSASSTASPPSKS